MDPEKVPIVQVFPLPRKSSPMQILPIIQNLPLWSFSDQFGSYYFPNLPQL